MGVVAFALLLALSQPEPSHQLAVCEAARRSNLDDALTWEGRAHEARVNHHACLDRLAVRTATPTPSVVELRSIESEWTAPKLVLGGTLVFLSGVAAGLLTALVLR